jgi:hypothetical protein
MARYIALVDGRSGSYGLTVPDLPGCTSAAATIDTRTRPNLRQQRGAQIGVFDQNSTRAVTPHHRSHRIPEIRIARLAPARRRPGPCQTARSIPNEHG